MAVQSVVGLFVLSYSWQDVMSVPEISLLCMSQIMHTRVCLYLTQRTEQDLDLATNRYRPVLMTSSSVNQSARPLHLTSNSVNGDVIDDVTVTSYRDTVPRKMHNSYTLAIFLSCFIPGGVWYFELISNTAIIAIILSIAWQRWHYAVDSRFDVKLAKHRRNSSFLVVNISKIGT